MKRVQWAGAGDVNAFFGLMLDNIANLVLLVTLLPLACGTPANSAGEGFTLQNFVITKMLPGTAIGVLVGDLAFFVIALRLIRRTGRSDVTAMPLGIDTPSLFGMIFFVLGPAFVHARTSHSPALEDAAHYAWRIGMCSIITSGVFKLACSLVSGQVRRLVPRAGLLGSLAAVALVLIGFIPLLEIARTPVVGFAALAVILTTLTARVQLPLKIPGALGALLVGGCIYYLMSVTGTLGHPPSQSVPTSLGLLLPDLTVPWWTAYVDSLSYLPIVLPFALATVVGGIDCTESAAAVGDEYSTGQVIAVEGIATVLAGLCGGVIQTTPYIGHPAYKAMGGRAAYTLATALFIGGAGLLGYFGYLYQWIPQAALYPILVFVGLEITSQSYHATPSKHYPAVAIACIPALAYLVMIYADQIMTTLGKSIDDLWPLNPTLAENLQTLRTLAGGGAFVLTSLLWASAVAALIDRKLRVAAGFFAIAAACSLFGVIHSPAKGGNLVLPWHLPTDLPAEAISGQTPYYMAGAYALMAVMLSVWSLFVDSRNEATAQDVLHAREIGPQA